MRPSNSVVLNKPANANQTSTNVWADNIVAITFQLIASGTAAGNFQVQASDDYLPGTPTTNTQQPVNWNNVGAAITVAGAGAYMTPVISTSYEWLRLVYTDTSGGAATGTVFARAKALAYG